MKKLASYVGGAWVTGTGAPRVLVNPATEQPIAEASTAGVDFAAAVEHARAVGGAALRALTYPQRAQVLAAMAAAIHEHREDLIALAVANGGNTRSDAKFDIDGASATLAAYAEIGRAITDGVLRLDGEGVQLGRSPRLHGQHVWSPRRGVAVHINAFNFPAWGLAEKAAVALLAGVPVITKPATATALVAHRMMEIFIDGDILPEGVLSLVSGSVGDLLSHMRDQDVLAFTGSSATATALRAHETLIRYSVPINIEADSLNAAVLGPDVDAGSETESLFATEVARDITQKTGQKCTAIRRIYVPADKLDRVVELLADRLGGIKVGNPADDGVRMGPVATAAQRDDVRAGIARLVEQTEPGYGDDGSIDPGGDGRGFFVGPVLRVARDARSAPAMHEHEVFGPVATVAPYDGDPTAAAELVRLGGGGLVASIYSDDRTFVRAIIPELASHHGRLVIGSAKVAGVSPGPGTVLPQLTHGGPGRAGAGEELGGPRGMSLYQQRTALQGDKALLNKILAG